MFKTENPQRTFLTVCEAAQYLGVSRSQMYAQRRIRRWCSFGVGRPQFHFNLADLDAHLEKIGAKRLGQYSTSA